MLGGGAEENEFDFLLSQYGFDRLVCVPTRHGRGSSSCIDNVFVRRLSGGDDECLVLDLGVSDHCMLSCNITTIPLGLPASPVGRVREAAVINYQSLNDALRFCDWGEALGDHDINLKFEIFLKRLGEFIEDCTSVRRIPSKHVRLKPWMTPHLLGSIRSKNALKLLASRRPGDVRLKRRAKSLEKIVGENLKLAKDSYYSTRFRFAKGDGKKQWAIINELLGKNRGGAVSVDGILIDDSVCRDSITIANHMNEYFIETPMRLAELVQREQDYLPGSTSHTCLLAADGFFLNPHGSWCIPGISAGASMLGSGGGSASPAGYLIVECVGIAFLALNKDFES
ncbi:hypothetical protein DMENIID0001_054520 [Sergentomyia squamirostris]